MALFSINNVSIKGISACVPKHTVSNYEHPTIGKEDIEKFIQTTGVENRRIASENVCTSDLCFEAAEKLLSDLNWNKEEIDILVFVSQTGDYLLPVTSALLQNRLGLSQNCLAFDIPLGCSGYIYGASVIAGLLNSSRLKKGLLLVGDTSSKWVSPTDKSTEPLFGDAGAATAFEYDENAAPFKFHLGTDGSGYKAIIIPDGGSRSPINERSLTATEFAEGISRNNCQLALEGMDVFAFGISQAPKTVNELLKGYNIETSSVDYFIFHQANKMMNKMIAKKLKLPEEKVPYSLKDFGNTSSATIPLTIISELRSKLKQTNNFIFCGFGVGLSWGTMYVENANFHCSELVEI